MNNNVFVPRIEIVNRILDIMEDRMEFLPNGHSVAYLDFTDTVGHDECQLHPSCEITYHIGIGNLPKNVNAETAALALSSAVHASYHEYQIMHGLNYKNRERMLVDWMATAFNPMFYNTTLHYNSFEAEAYYMSIVKTRPIMINLFGKDGETALLKTYMDRTHNFDNACFTHSKRYDYTDIDEYIYDINKYIVSLNGPRPPINARKLYEPSTRIPNTKSQVSDYCMDDWGIYLNQIANHQIDKSDEVYLKAFQNAYDEYDQAKLTAMFVRQLHPEIAHVIPIVNNLEFYIHFFNQKTPTIQN